MANQATSKASDPANIKKLTINSNESGNIDVKDATIRLMYYESILQDAVRASITSSCWSRKSSVKIFR
jgi:hypothetical protein